MKKFFKFTLCGALVIMFAMLAHVRTSSAQEAEEQAPEAAEEPAPVDASRPGQPANEPVDAPASNPPATGEPASSTAAELASKAQSAAEPASESADTYLERGLAHYRARRFEKAIKAFHAGYKIEARPEFLFAIGQAERRSGDCASALAYYRRFIATAPPARQEQAARMHMRRCERALVSGPVAGPRRSDSVSRRSSGKARRARPLVTVAPQPAPRPSAPSTSPWYHDVTGGVLLGTGTVTVLAGAGLVIASGSAQDRASWAATYPEYDLEINRAQRYRLWGIAALGAGTAMIAGAVLRYKLRSPGRSTEARELGLLPSSGGLTISYGGRF